MTTLFESCHSVEYCHPDKNCHPKMMDCHPERSEGPAFFRRGNAFRLRTAILSRAPHILLLLATALFLLPLTAHAQGCTQCLDSTHATPPAVQAAYRHAIYLLGGAGATLFIAATLLIRRER